MKPLAEVDHGGRRIRCYGSGGHGGSPMSTYVIYGADVETVIAVWVVGAVIVAVVCARGSCRRPGTCFCRCC